VTRSGVAARVGARRGAERLFQRLSDSMPRIEGRIRILEDHLDCPSNAGEVSFRHGAEIRRRYAVDGDVAGVWRFKADEAAPNRGLARAGFADEADALSGHDAQRYAFCRADGIASTANERLDERIDADEWPLRLRPGAAFSARPREPSCAEHRVLLESHPGGCTQ